MQVQVNTTGLPNKESLDRWAEQYLQDELARFRHDITRIEVHLSDENGGKAGGADKRCLLEVRLAHHQPLAVHHDADSQDLAVRGAADKLKRLVEHTVDRGRDNRHRERESIRKDGVPDADQADAAAL
ncbi:HPF/RaiA family ribosome-associated protein [Pseudorhodoferax sp. LjRoot39]|uniref:HPF/RaiA family ribosome-associated protein n=1 Tax=Pseudorhodoferax sp. LjRoot39 TaxID=3342328 RepID=UPI003ECCB2F2